MNKRIFALATVALASVIVLAGCGGRNTERSQGKTNLNAALVLGNDGVDDRSFNQSAWEGLQAWGKDNGLSKGKGINYFQSNSPAEFTSNFNSAVSGGYDLVFSIGFVLHEATSQAAQNNPDTKFAVIDSVIEGKDNVVSATFADQQSAYLAGVAAAKTSKTNHVGFIGGIKSDVLAAFETGFTAGAKSVSPDIKVDVQYAQSFTDAGKGKTMASAMYASGADVIYQAAGSVGTGLFTEAKNLNETRKEEDKVWVVGVDQDQEYLGGCTSKDGKKSNFVLVSTVKEVGNAVKDIANRTEKGKFPGGENLKYDLSNGGVTLARDNASDEAWKAVEAAKADIVSGKIEVPAK